MFLVYDLEEEVVTHRFQDFSDAVIVRDALNDIETVHRRIFPNMLRRIQTFTRHVVVRDSGTNLNDPNNAFHSIPTISFVTGGGGVGAGAGASASVGGDGNAYIPRH